MTAMYQRKDVYRAFGFDAFIHDTTMHSAEKIDNSDFISDESAFEEVTRQIAESEKPLFVNLVTMQNHYPMADEYKDPWPVSGVKGDVKRELSGYSRGINYSDKALMAMLKRLSASKEKTAVIFYGDHLPAFWPEEIYEKNGDPAMKSTPFFIWTNFKTPKLDTAPLTSPIYFLPLLFNQIGAKLPPYYALLTEMYNEVPAMEQDVEYGANGEPVVDDPRLEQLLHDYRLVQYDLSIGKRYSQAGLFYSN
jgi:phosphoglycerol transferase MdoB-like AlkP superfamily enzyme